MKSSYQIPYQSLNILAINHLSDQNINILLSDCLAAPFQIYQSIYYQMTLFSCQTFHQIRLLRFLSDQLSDQIKNRGSD